MPIPRKNAMNRPTYFFISVILCTIILSGLYNLSTVSYNNTEISSTSFFPLFKRRDREPKPPAPTPEVEKERPFLKKLGAFFTQFFTASLGWMDIPNKMERVILAGFCLMAFLGSLTFYVLVKKYRRKT